MESFLLYKRIEQQRTLPIFRTAVAQAVIRNLEKPFEKKERFCCCVVVAHRATTTQQQLFLFIFGITAAQESELVS
jgi:hypothetical protein